MDRRDLLKFGALTAIQAGCNTGSTRAANTLETAAHALEPGAMDVSQYLASMDRSMLFIQRGEFFPDMVRAAAIDAALSPDELQWREALARKSTRTLLATTMINDLPEQDRQHPAVLSRVRRLASEVDEATVGMADWFERLSQHDHRSVRRKLRSDPETVVRIANAIDAKAEIAEVNARRRRHLREMFAIANQRMSQQDPGIVVDEYTRVVRRVQSLAASRNARTAQASMPEVAGGALVTPSSGQEPVMAPSGLLSAGYVVTGLSIAINVAGAALTQVAGLGPIGVIMGPVTVGGIGLIVGLIMMAVGANRPAVRVDG